MTESAVVADRILAVFRELPNRPILGSNLGLQIKTYFPDFHPAEYGCRNLRHFLHVHVPGIGETGRHGQDVEYSLRPAGSAVGTSPAYSMEKLNAETRPATPTQPIRHDLWKTFVSPTGAYQMFVDPEQHSFQVLRRGDPAPPAPWVHVPACPAEVHISIAREFLQRISDPAHGRELENVLASGIWWVEFLRIARLRGLDRDWIKFRRDRLSQEFEGTLSALGVPISAAAETWPLSALRPQRRMPGAAPLPDEQLRNALQRVVGRLSEEELRRIWLPVGIVIDEVRGK